MVSLRLRPPVGQHQLPHLVAGLRMLEDQTDERTETLFRPSWIK